MRKFLVFLVSVIFALASTGANADIVYLTDSGALGRIGITGAESTDLYGTQYAVSWNDPFLGSYWDGSNSRVILVERETDTAASGDTALVFNPADLTRPIDSERKVLAGVYSAQAMAGSENGRGIFFASGSSIHEFSTSDFSLSRSYTYKPKTSEDITAEITALMTGSNVIYALVKQENSCDIFLGFDGQLREDVTKNFERTALYSDAAAISWLSNARIAAGHTDGIDVRGRNSRVFGRMLSTDVPVKALCEDAGDGVYFIEQSEIDDVYTTSLKHYISDTEITELFTNTEGQAYTLLRDKDSGIVSAIVGDVILVYMMDGDILLGKYDSSELGGIPVQIASSTVSGDDGKSSSGCSVSGMGMLLILAAGCMFLKRYGI